MAARATVDGDGDGDGALGFAARHSQLQQVSRRRRRCHRERERAQLLLPASTAAREDDNISERRRGAADHQAQELALLQATTARRGFTAYQLTSPALRPLERWYYQLQLLTLSGAPDEAPSNSFADAVVNDGEHEVGADRPTALVALERVLARDVACFDLQYATGARVQDVAKSLLESSSPSEPAPSLPEEILSFSTMKSGRACRVTCLQLSLDDSQFAFHSSLFIDDFTARATQLLAPSTSHASSLIEFAWRELAP